jgi:spore maturation protein CgeB
MLVEDTTEHREIFGEELRAVAYFKSKDEMLNKLRWLLSNSGERERMADAAHRLVTQGRNTYEDRLLTMIGCNRAGVQA